MEGVKLDSLQSLAKKLSHSEQIVTKALIELDTELKKRLSGIQIWGEGRNINLEMIDEDEWRYGHLIYDQDGLQIATRTTLDDLEDGFNHVSRERQVFNIEPLRAAKSAWHIKLSDEKVIGTLLLDIEKNIRGRLAETEQSVSSLDKILQAESSAINQDVQNVLSSYPGLLTQWVKARTLVEIDPADSITRSCSYLESTCRLVIEESQQQLPNTRDITNLVKSALNCLAINSYAEHEVDVKKLVGGIKSIFSAVGAIRTHVGTAHGSSPGDGEADEVTAQLVNNSAATVSIYLLRHHKKTNNPLNDDAACGAH